MDRFTLRLDLNYLYFCSQHIGKEASFEEYRERLSTEESTENIVDRRRFRLQIQDRRRQNTRRQKKTADTRRKKTGIQKKIEEE